MENETTITHDFLVKKGIAHLKKTPKKNCRFGACSVVLSEEGCYGSKEIPDVIGWSNATSILIECKTSRSDFLADKKKFFRIYPEQGMGNYRYFLIPDTDPVIFHSDELPEKWGLLVLVGKRIMEIVEPGYFDAKYCAWAERPLMFSALRRRINETTTN